MAKTTVPIELSSTPSIVDNGNATAITINSSEQVGIGGTPFYSLDVQGSATDYEGLRVLNTNTAASPTTSAILLGVANSVRNVYTKIQTIEGGSDANETRLAFFTNDSSNNLTEALRIDENQNVGIGTTNPTYPLVVSRSGAGIKSVFTNTTDADLAINLSSGVSLITPTTGTLAFGTSSTERMRIDSSGNVGIKQTSPSSPNGSTDFLHIGNSASTYSSIVLQDNNNTWEIFQNNQLSFRDGTDVRLLIDTAGDVLINSTSATGAEKVHIAFNRTSEWGLVIANTSSTAPSAATMVDFRYAGTQTGYISSNGTTTTYSTTSDYRTKENVIYDWDATTRLKQLKPARFNFISNADTTYDGFLAHEVSSIVPEAIVGEKDAVDDEGNAVYQGIDQSKLVPLLVKTIQELEARITALEGN